MRIIGGKWRGRPLAAPAGEATRPTSDRAREALFSMLTSRLGSFDGLAVADLFAGTGALGLEALSRGAERALFVERDRGALTALRANIDRLVAGGAAEIRAQGVETLGQPAAAFDLLLLDPPYGDAAARAALARLVSLGWVSPGGWVSLETARDEDVAIDGLRIEVERIYGKAKLSLLRLG